MYIANKVRIFTINANTVNIISIFTGRRVKCWSITYYVLLYTQNKNPNHSECIFLSTKLNILICIIFLNIKIKTKNVY